MAGFCSSQSVHDLSISTRAQAQVWQTLKERLSLTSAWKLGLCSYLCCRAAAWFWPSHRGYHCTGDIWTCRGAGLEHQPWGDFVHLGQSPSHHALPAATAPFKSPAWADPCVLLAWAEGSGLWLPFLLPSFLFRDTLAQAGKAAIHTGSAPCPHCNMV